MAPWFAFLMDAIEQSIFRTMVRITLADIIHAMD